MCREKATGGKQAQKKGLITDIEKYFFYKVDGHIYCARTRRWRRDEEGAGEVENVWLVYKKSESEIGLIPYELIE